MTRYAVAACQTEMPNPLGREEMRANTDRMLAMIDAAVAGAAPFIPVRDIYGLAARLQFRPRGCLARHFPDRQAGLLTSAA